MEFEIRDMSAEVFGKYQYCTSGPDGRFYADSDFSRGFGIGEPKIGSVSTCGHVYQSAANVPLAAAGGAGEVSLYPRLRERLDAAARRYR